MMRILRGDPFPYLPAPRAWFRRLCGEILFYGSAAAVACLLALVIATIF
jgi:hypothetical protein